MARHGVRRRFPILTLGMLVILILGLGALTRSRAAGEPLLGERRSPIMIAWTTGDIDPGWAASIGALDSVSRVAEVRNGIGWLSSWGPTGAPPSTPPAGFFVPIEIAAVDPAAYSPFVPERDRALFGRLAQGGAILSRTGARLRGIEETGTLQFREAAVPVIGVVDDVLLASHEAIVSKQTGTALGIEDPKYALIAIKPGSGAGDVEAGLRARLPQGKKLGTRTPGDDARALRPGGTILPQAEVKVKFGEFSAKPGRGAPITIDPNWIEANTANVTFPLLGTPTRCHKAMIPIIRDAMDDIARQGLGALVRKGDFGGCFSPRLLNSDPHSGISRHAWGAAFDFNVSQNPAGVAPKMDPRLIEILRKHGLAWGGDWMVPDGMHFEYLEEAD